jgi:hypothetical protein
MLMSIFGQAVLRLSNADITQVVLAVGQQGVAKSIRVSPQDEHQIMYAISLLKHHVVVLRESEGPQKW